MNVTIFGTGYVGLVQGAVLANAGHSVMCVDIDPSKIADLKQGMVDIFEPGLSTLVHEMQKKGRLTFTVDVQEAVHHGDILMIAVGTPSDEDGSADLRHVLSVADTIACHMSAFRIIVNKSTVPVGTADLVRDTIKSKLRSLGKITEFEVASNPEFLKEGSAVLDCQKPDRIIIGTDNAFVESKLRELYSPFNRNHDKIHIMDVRSAELTKYAANCMLATKISFMNELANLAEKLGADIEAVRQGIGSDPRIGYHFTYPGAGYGGSCFPKDVRALIHTAEGLQFDSLVLKAVEKRNQLQKQVLFKKINTCFQGALQGKKMAIWGLAFKPNTDDMREAPSRVLIDALWKSGVQLQAYDPVANEKARELYASCSSIRFTETQDDALWDVDALVIMTEWQSFRAPDFELMKKRMKCPLIFDGRNMYEPTVIEKKGFRYYSIGRKDVRHELLSDTKECQV